MIDLFHIFRKRIDDKIKNLDSYDNETEEKFKIINEKINQIENLLIIQKSKFMPERNDAENKKERNQIDELYTIYDTIIRHFKNLEDNFTDAVLIEKGLGKIDTESVYLEPIKADLDSLIIILDIYFKKIDFHKSEDEGGFVKKEKLVELLNELNDSKDIKVLKGIIFKESKLINLKKKLEFILKLLFENSVDLKEYTTYYDNLKQKSAPSKGRNCSNLLYIEQEGDEIEEYLNHFIFQEYNFGVLLRNEFYFNEHKDDLDIDHQNLIILKDGVEYNFHIILKNRISQKFLNYIREDKKDDLMKRFSLLK